jgi:intracellular sulfur oxidation DsrE/DsrF family protein
MNTPAHVFRKGKMKPDTSPLRILLHAPTAAALTRARNNANNIAADVRIVVNGDAVADVLEAPDAILDTRTLVCSNTLGRMGRDAPSPLVVLPRGAALSLALMQREGWCYVRA